MILSVPCCQHEVNKQMKSDLFAPVFRYGIIKERMAALYTDALRAEILEAMGYRVQILEFIDMEHTPKNLLIRAVKQGKKKENRKEIEAILEAIHAEPPLYRLLLEKSPNVKLPPAAQKSRRYLFMVLRHIFYPLISNPCMVACFNVILGY